MRMEKGGGRKGVRAVTSASDEVWGVGAKKMTQWRCAGGEATVVAVMKIGEAENAARRMMMKEV